MFLEESLILINNEKVLKSLTPKLIFIVFRLTGHVIIVVYIIWNLYPGKKIKNIINNNDDNNSNNNDDLKITNSTCRSKRR